MVRLLDEYARVSGYAGDNAKKRGMRDMRETIYFANGHLVVLNGYTETDNPHWIRQLLEKGYRIVPEETNGESTSPSSVGAGDDSVRESETGTGAERSTAGRSRSRSSLGGTHASRRSATRKRA